MLRSEARASPAFRTGHLARFSAHACGTRLERQPLVEMNEWLLVRTAAWAVLAVAAGGSCACRWQLQVAAGGSCGSRWQLCLLWQQVQNTAKARALQAAEQDATEQRVPWLLRCTRPRPCMDKPCALHDLSSRRAPLPGLCMHARTLARARTHTHTRTTQTFNNCLATVHRALCQSSPAQHTAGRTRSPCPLTAQPCGAGPAHLMHASTGQLGAGLVLEVKHGLRCHAQCKGRAGSVLGLVAQASLIWICALALMHCRLVSNHACGLQHGGMRRARRPMAAWITAAAACIRLSSCIIKLLPTLQCPPLHPLHAPPQGTAGSPPALPSTTCAPPPWPWTSTWRPKGMVGKEAMVGKDG